MHVIIPRSTTPPTGEYTIPVAAATDSATRVAIKFFEGERAIAAGSYFLGEVLLPAAKDQDIDVKVMVDEIGILHEHAENSETYEKEFAIILKKRSKE